MAELKVSRRYAKSLLGLAEEQNNAAQVYADMQMVASVCKENRELTLLMGNPIIHNYKKEAVLSQIFASRVSKVTLEFMMMMIRKGRVGLIDDIAREYVSIYKEMNGIHIAHVTTAVPLDDQMRRAVMAIVKEREGDKVELIEQVDPSLIGGFILRFNDVQYDSSVSRKLSDISRQLHSSSYTRSI